MNNVQSGKEIEGKARESKKSKPEKTQSNIGHRGSDRKPTNMRLAKAIARTGLCSRREAERWIIRGRVKLNGQIIRTPAVNIGAKDKVEIDDKPLIARSATRLWLYHKPKGLIVTEKDPKGRRTIFAELNKLGLPRLLSIGRLDINTEGLLLLTNDGGLKRILELPSTGWLRRYRVRAFGKINEQQLAELKNGIEINNIKYGPIEATIEREKGANVWLNIALREGKNREIKKVLASLGLEVNRLIRVSYGPFLLSDLPKNAVKLVKNRVLKEQLGKKLAKLANVDFSSPIIDYETKPNISSKQTIVKKRTLPDKSTKATKEKINKKPAPFGKENSALQMGGEYGKPKTKKSIIYFPDGRSVEEFEPVAKQKNRRQNRRKKNFTKYKDS